MYHFYHSFAFLHQSLHIQIQCRLISIHVLKKLHPKMNPQKELKKQKNILSPFTHSNTHIKWYSDHPIRLVILEEPERSHPLPLDQHGQSGL